MDFYKNTYRIKSARLEDWDYSSAGYYFITICTKDKKCFFGKVQDAEIYLSNIGKIVSEAWLNAEKVRKNVTLDQWIVMPNHLHGIIILGDSNGGISVETPGSASQTNLTQPNKSVQAEIASHRKQTNNISSIIRCFKSQVTKRIHLLGNTEFSWQSRYYDHIIRNEKSLEKIRQYIFSNPVKWELDEYNPNNS